MKGIEDFNLEHWMEGREGGFDIIPKQQQLQSVKSLESVLVEVRPGNPSSSTAANLALDLSEKRPLGYRMHICPDIKKIVKIKSVVSP